MSTETVLTVILQIWTLRGRRTEAFGNTADWTLSAIDPFVRVDPRAVPLISPVFNFTFRSGWTSTDGSASYGALLVVDVFIDVATVTELTVLAIYWWIGGAFGERRTTALKHALRWVTTTVHYSVGVLRMTQVSVLPHV